MKSSFRIGRIAGIDIGANQSWLLAFFLIAWSLAAGFFPQNYPGWNPASYWIAGALGAILLFVCVLLHELAHSLVAKSRGMQVSSITLFIFGGVSNLQDEPESAGTEFVMAFVGPLTSLTLGGIFFLIGRIIILGNNPLSALIWYLNYVNIALGLFNLIPGFPLDGGRVLRSIIWGVTHNLKQATNVATMVGQLFGWGFILYGVYIAFTVPGGLINGLWIGFIGWFLTSAAESSRRELSMREYLQGVKVSDVMDPSPECVPPQTQVDSVVQNVFYEHGYRAAPVCLDDKVLGIVTITDVKKLPHEEWNRTPVDRIMSHETIYSIRSDADLNSALRLLAEHELNQLLVIDDDKLKGLLNRAHVIRYLQMNQELGIRRRRETTSSSTPTA